MQSYINWLSGYCRSGILRNVFYFLLAIIAFGCNTTRHLKQDEYLLQKNVINLQSDRGLTSRGELSDNLEALIVQKPNTRTFLFNIPYKLLLYNSRYDQYSRNDSSFQLKSKTVEPPVLFDSLLLRRSAQNMRSFLFNQGYFHAQVLDTYKLQKQKAIALFNVNTGPSYLVAGHQLVTSNNDIRKVIEDADDETFFRKGARYSMALLDQERNRIVNLLKEEGFYRFSQEYIRFEIDTINKSLLRNTAPLLENAINRLALQKQQKQPTLIVKTIINTDKLPQAAMRYGIRNVIVYPDFISREDAQDSSMYEVKYKGVTFRYHQYYIRENVIYQNLALEQNKRFTQHEYDGTIARLNSLGIFQTVRIVLVEDTSALPEHLLNMFVLLTPADKNDAGINFEVSNGTTYVLGSALTFNYRNRNFFRGGNLFSASASVGLESDFKEQYSDQFFSKFRLLTRNFGVNTSLDFPKYLLPGRQDRFSKKNLPRTVITTGFSLLDRVDFFTLSNATTNITYNWRETSTKNWAATPVFVNVIRLPNVSDSFRRRLQNNTFLQNSYREVFIEGQTLSFTFSNQADNRGRSYTYARLSMEEAGGLLSGITALTGGSNKSATLPFAQYVRFDYDLRRYVNYYHSQIAIRMYGGIGLPYAASPTLPYIKQYFVGGPYSIRGWRIRSLGPGSYRDTTAPDNALTIDRTGDIKMEINGEYRFDVVQLFSGTIKMKGALFADAGNIWLSEPSNSFPGGEFAFNKLGRDLAVSTGAGARFNLADLFILRIDAAFPIKKPYYFSNGGWVLDQIDFGNKNWRSQNLILNFAIGYPF